MLPTTLLIILLTTLATSRVINRPSSNLPQVATREIKTVTSISSGEHKIQEIDKDTPLAGTGLALLDANVVCAEGYHLEGLLGCTNGAAVSRYSGTEKEKKMEGETNFDAVRNEGKEKREVEGGRLIVLCCTGFLDCLMMLGKCKNPK